MPRGIPNVPAAAPEQKVNIAKANKAMSTLKRAIRRYVRAEVDHSWKGAQEPIYHADIDEELEASRNQLEGVIYALALDASIYIGAEFPEEPSKLHRRAL